MYEFAWQHASVMPGRATRCSNKIPNEEGSVSSLGVRLERLGRPDPLPCNPCTPCIPCSCRNHNGGTHREVPQRCSSHEEHSRRHEPVNRYPLAVPGNVTALVVPTPTVLSARTLPPCASARCLKMASPSPVPPSARDLPGTT